MKDSKKDSKEMPRGKAEAAETNLTPLMEQYYAVKKKHPDALVLFRVGDFFETFGKDAIETSRLLDILLTKRANGTAAEVALAGFPHHVLHTHLPRLTAAGRRVAVYDQQETPEEARARGSKIVRRTLVELATPALSLPSQGEEKKNRYLAAIYLSKTPSANKPEAGLSLFDLSTGTFFVYEGSKEAVWTQLMLHAPVELIFSRDQKKDILPQLDPSLATHVQEEWVYTEGDARRRLSSHFNTTTLAGFGIESYSAGLVAAGAILVYLKEGQFQALEHMVALTRLDNSSHLWMDAFTVRNLELLEPLIPGGHTLLKALDETKTPMGGRLLRAWVCHPLASPEAIYERQACVSDFVHHAVLCDTLREAFGKLGDIERLAGRIALGRFAPRDLLRLAQSLYQVEDIKTLISSCDKKAPLRAFESQLVSLSELADTMQEAILPEAALSPVLGRVFEKGYHKELDELLNKKEGETQTLARIQQEESRQRGIPSLKVGYNRVFGYYLEVRNTHKEKVPKEWQRKQTLTGAERYTTVALQALEVRMQDAEVARATLEGTLYEALVRQVITHMGALKSNAQALATLDVLANFAYLAKKRNYVCPTLHTQTGIKIEAGRHPVIEAHMPADKRYVPNSLVADPTNQQIILLTGPNMAGKSALLRQTALIAFMAQMGSFVPAKAADLGIFDKLFTRVGAGENISAGQSTFMVEMNEMASILHNMTDKSLLLIDEVGRGTSTYDGLSVAWALLEYMHEHSRALGLFATHYHELTELEAALPRLVNFHIAVKEIGNEVIFLHQLRKGSTQQSFGIQVARMAGMPAPLISRAKDILSSLQKQRIRARTLTKKASTPKDTPGLQPSLF